MLHSGYAPLPRRKMLWESKVDCRNPMVVDAIRRDDVDAVLNNLHFRDNTSITEDRYYKVLSDSILAFLFSFLFFIIIAPLFVIVENVTHLSFPRLGPSMTT